MKKKPISSVASRSEKKELLESIKKEVSQKRENLGFSIKKNQEAKNYEKSILPFVQIILKFVFDRPPTKKDDETLREIIEEKEFASKRLGGGSYGEVTQIKMKSWRRPIAVKTQACSKEYRKELELLRKSNRLNLPFMGKILDAYTMKDSCILILPVADGSLSKMPINLLHKNLRSIIMQAVTGIFLFHSYLDAHHCDAHAGNWFFFKKKFKSMKIAEFTIASADVELALYDPGLGVALSERPLGEPLPDVNDECRSPVYDYFRLFSSHAGLMRAAANESLVRACSVYFNHYDGNYLTDSGSRKREFSSKPDWELRFPVVKSEKIWRDLMTIASENLSYKEVSLRWAKSRGAKK